MTANLYKVEVFTAGKKARAEFVVRGYPSSYKPDALCAAMDYFRLPAGKLNCGEHGKTTRAILKRCEPITWCRTGGEQWGWVIK
jgi:hypothetical protein